MNIGNFAGPENHNIFFIYSEERKKTSPLIKYDRQYSEYCQIANPEVK